MAVHITTRHCHEQVIKFLDIALVGDNMVPGKSVEKVFMQIQEVVQDSLKLVR